MAFKKQVLVGAFLSLFSTITASTDCSDLKLPWGTYKATEMSNGSICKFSNVRFASAPVGELRFAAPKYPPEKGEPEAEGEPACMQMKIEQCGMGSPLGSGNCFPSPAGQQTEDCLFLDVYVPKSALNEKDSQLPVVVYIYGGAFVFGSKTQYPAEEMPFYDGQGLLEAADEPVIFVAGNYRLGAYGWMGGSYMEEHGQPNAGLLDQRAVLQFVKDHIHRVKGDPDNVSVWGSSAGASSIMHHLTMPANVEKPLFHRAIVQSPAYQWLWNRTGVMNDTFTSFYETVAQEEGCGADVSAMDCIRNADPLAVQYANQAMFRSIACQGIMPVGPSVDGKLIEDIVTNVYSDSKKLADLDSLIVSHVDNEVPLEYKSEKFSFIPFTVRMFRYNEEVFQDFLEHFMLGDDYRSVRANISDQYKAGPFKDQVARTRKIVEQSCFYCNTRVMLDAYRSKGASVYAMNYAYLNKVGGVLNLATHGSDLLPTFTNGRSNLTDFYHCLSQNILDGHGLSNYTVKRLGPGLRSYFVSHAISGDPNVHAVGDAAENRWEEARHDSSANRVTRVMQPRGGLASLLDPFGDNLANDDANSAEKCSFWKQIAKDVSKAYNSAQASCDADTDKGEERPTLRPGEQVILGEWEL